MRSNISGIGIVRVPSGMMTSTRRPSTGSAPSPRARRCPVVRGSDSLRATPCPDSHIHSLKRGRNAVSARCSAAPVRPVDRAAARGTGSPASRARPAIRTSPTGSPERDLIAVPQDRREAAGAADAPVLRAGRLLNQQHVSLHVPRDRPADAPAVTGTGVLAVRERDVRPAIGAAGELAAVDQQARSPSVDAARCPPSSLLKFRTTFGPVTPACVTTGQTPWPVTLDRSSRICVPEIAKSAGAAGAVNGSVCRMCTFSIVTRRTVDPNVVLFCVSTDTTSRTHPSLDGVHPQQRVLALADRLVLRRHRHAQRLDADLFDAARETCTSRPSCPADSDTRASNESDSGTSNVMRVAWRSTVIDAIVR